MTYMFTPLTLEDGETNEVLYKEPYSSSPFAARPLFLLLGKETLENLADIEIAMKERRDASFKFMMGDREYEVAVDALLTMIDGKMRALLTGLGGAYCLLCTVEKDVANGKGCTDPLEFMNINRSHVETKADYDRLLKVNGGVKKRKGDYLDRKGITQRPVAGEDLNDISPLHCVLRGFDFPVSLQYHLRSETFQWTESELNLGRATTFYKDAKTDIRANVKDATGISMDAADPTGNGINNYINVTVIS